MHANGELSLWQLGLTASKDSRLAKMSATKKRLHHAGLVCPWNKGLTKDDDLRLAQAGRKIAASYEARVLSGWESAGSSGCTFWWTDGVIRRNRFQIRANKGAGISQKNAAALQGHQKIWGCNQKIWVLSN